MGVLPGHALKDHTGPSLKESQAQEHETGDPGRYPHVRRSLHEGGLRNEWMPARVIRETTLSTCSFIVQEFENPSKVDTS